MYTNNVFISKLLKKPYHYLNCLEYPAINSKMERSSKKSLLPMMSSFSRHIRHCSYVGNDLGSPDRIRTYRL